MNRRHFLVSERNGQYELKSLDPNLARAMDKIGILTGYFFHRVTAEQWTFYFMNCQITAHCANEVAQKLSSQLLQDISYYEA